LIPARSEIAITADPLHSDLPAALLDHIREVRQQLDAYSAGLQTSNPELYRDLALYLQVLREGLLNTVQQACFHLATRFYPERYCELPPQQRTALHGRIAELVRRCCSLLTVEQLVQLAGQTGREQRQQRQRRQREWLAQLRKEGEELSQPPAADPLEDGSAELAGVDPAGSVHLHAALPVDLVRWQALTGLHPESAADPSGESEAALEQESGAALENDFDPVDEDDEHGQDSLEGLLGPQADALLDSLMEAGTPGRVPPPWDSAVLPTDPQALQEWLEGFELALVRRLRNLSHALNVELLRGGLSHSLLPTSLLQAALQGQLEPQPAPANLLRLQVPLAPDGGGELDSVALLLRLSDLELGLPRLRSCRSRWQHHRQEVRRMAQRYGRLQRQLQRLEAERLWHQDNSSHCLPSDPSQPSTRPG